MASKSVSPGEKSLGVIRLDYDYPPAPGDIDHPQSYGYKVNYRVIPGLTFEMCQSGKLTPEVEKAFKEGIDHLVKMGAGALTGDCGFMMYLQKLAREYSRLPVFMSALAQLPAVTSAFAKDELIAIMTANGESLKPMRSLIKDECQVDVDEKRFIMVGCEDVPGFEAVALGKKVDVAKVTPGMVAKAKKVIAENPNVRALLLECTELPPYADALREATGLPVYDAITCCNFFTAGLYDNPSIDIKDFKNMWDPKKNEYKFGANLSEKDKAKLVNQIKADEKKSTKICAPSLPKTSLTFWKNFAKGSNKGLGVLQCDYDAKGGIKNLIGEVGDLANPRSFIYPVQTYKVPGLTVEMCHSGKLTPEVEKAFGEGIDTLAKRGVGAITGEYSFMMHFQKMARERTKLPVFMSPLAQIPAVTCAYAKDETVAIFTAKADELKKMKSLIAEECHFYDVVVDVDSKGPDRLMIVGCEDVPGFEAVESRELKLNKSKVLPALVSKVKKVLKENPYVCAIMLDNSQAAVFSDSLRKETGLPVYDAITCCNLVESGHQDNPRF